MENKATPPITLLTTSLLSVAFAIPLAYGYAYAINYIPFVYLNFFVTFFFGGFISIYQAAKNGKLANKAQLITLSIITALIAYYLHWAVYCSLNSNIISAEDMLLQLSTRDVLSNGFQTNNSTWHYITHPAQLFSTINNISKEGLWTFKDIEVKGVLLYIVWLVESFMIFGTALYMPLDMLKKNIDKEKLQ